MTEKEKQGRLSRWSERKLKAADLDATQTSEIDENEQRLIDEERELELAANRELAESIDLDTIDENSDLSLFMKEGVPDALKRKALATLWRSNPIFANIDGLNDYDEDFANPDLIMKTFTSAYQAGRGYLKEVLEESTDQEEVVEANQPVEEVAEIEVETEEEETFNVSSEYTEMEEEFDDDPAEDNATPKVSLRSRLQMDS